MKNSLNIILISLTSITSLLGLGGCSEDYLNREPSDYLTGEQIKRYSPLNPEIPNGIIRGIYSLTFEYGSGGSGGHDDFGQKSVDITTDLMSGDMVLTGKTYGWFSQDYELNNTNKTNSRTYTNWRYYYQIIKGANSVIDGLSGDSINSASPKIKAAYGQAKALRAYAYYYLVNLYQNPYTDNSTIKAIPVYLSQLTAEAAPLSTVEDVYKVIISDLETAVIMLKDFNRTNKNEINANVAKGLLAYAYLASGNYVKASELSGQVIASGEFRLMNIDEVVQSGFNSVNIPGWMWAIDLTTDNTTGLASFWGQMDIFTYSYAGAGDGKAIDIGLFNSIPNSDIRKSQFLNKPNDQYYLHPTYKFYDKARIVFNDRQWENDLVYMRVAEMYLIYAEANAHINPTESKKILRIFLAQREPGANARINALTDAQLMKEVYFQWRVEMWGEGKSFFAMKRFKETVTRGANHKYLANGSYPYNDDRIVFKIPENEINNNPQINGTNLPTKSATKVSSIISGK